MDSLSLVDRAYSYEETRYDGPQITAIHGTEKLADEIESFRGEYDDTLYSLDIEQIVSNLLRKRRTLLTPIRMSSVLLESKLVKLELKTRGFHRLLQSIPPTVMESKLSNK